MDQTTLGEYPPLQVTVNHWVPARIVLQQFVEAHPELGLRYSENTYYNFTRRHALELQAKGVFRRAYSRAPFTADVRRFDEAAYELVSQGLSHHHSVEADS
jgi:hypothetical protein